MSAAAQTSTGDFPIGVRRGWGAWQRDLPAFLTWTKEERIAHVDLGNDADTLADPLREAQATVGCVDLPGWKELLSPDPTRRRIAVDRAIAYVRRCAGIGITRFMTIMLPEDPARSREENFDHMIESYLEIAPVLEQSNAVLVIEGWPGPGALCCTPETLRALFAEIPSPAMGINYDPSHLLRMQIDPIRFLDEFTERIHHVHAKDTEWIAENVYEFGIEQPTTFAVPHKFGAQVWRYTIPGHGKMRWREALSRLRVHGYSGLISIELEDENFNGTDAGEMRAIRLARDFLEGC